MQIWSYINWNLGTILCPVNFMLCHFSAWFEQHWDGYMAYFFPDHLWKPNSTRFLSMLASSGFKSDTALQNKQCFTPVTEVEWNSFPFSYAIGFKHFRAHLQSHFKTNEAGFFFHWRFWHNYLNCIFQHLGDSLRILCSDDTILSTSLHLHVKTSSSKSNKQPPKLISNCEPFLLYVSSKSHDLSK